MLGISLLYPVIDADARETQWYCFKRNAVRWTKPSHVFVFSLFVSLLVCATCTYAKTRWRFIVQCLRTSDFIHKKTWMSRPMCSWLTQFAVFFAVFLDPGHRNCHQDHTRNQSWRCHLACSKPCRKHESVLSYIPFPKLTYPPKTGRAPKGNSSYSSSNHPLFFWGYVSFREGICPEYWWAENEISFEVVKFSGDMLIFGGVDKTNMGIVGSQGRGCNNRCAWQSKATHMIKQVESWWFKAWLRTSRSAWVSIVNTFAFHCK